MVASLEQRRFISKIEADFGTAVNEPGLENETKKARCFTALVLTTKCGAPFSDLSRYVVDGSNDLGLDGIYYNKATRILFFVQTKLRTNEKGFSEGEAHKFIRGVKKLVASDLKEANSKIKLLNSEIQEALEDIHTRVLLLVSCSSEAPLSSSVEQILLDYCNEANDFEEVFSYNYLSLKEVYSPARLFNKDASVAATIVFDEVCRLKTPHECLLGIVSGDQIAEMVERHGDRLFDQNVRLTLQSTDINDGILATAKKDPTAFFYFNNGLTAICSSFKAPPNVSERKSFEAYDLSIVNGAQTAGMLARAKFEKADLSNLRVPLRLISLSDAPAGFDEEVTRANNSQNALSSLDFVSLDARQELIRNELAALGYNYNVKRGGSSNQALEIIEVKDAAVALACKRSISLTAQAKRYVSGLWQDTSSLAYLEIFPPDISGIEVLAAWQIYNVCRDKISSQKATMESNLAAILTHGEKFIAYIAFRLVDQREDTFERGEIAAQAISEVLSAYQKRALINPPYDFRNVKLLEEMATEILAR